jgi:hypothetical protein
MLSAWVGLPQVGWTAVSGCVALRPWLPGVVVTWFVTGSRTSNLKRTVPLANSRRRMDYGAIAHDQDVGIGIGMRFRQ